MSSPPPDPANGAGNPLSKKSPKTQPAGVGGSKKSHLGKVDWEKSNLENNQQRLAGYLGFEDTGKIRSNWEDKDVKHICVSFYKVRQEKYGIDNPPSQVTREQMHDCYRQPKYHAFMISTKLVPIEKTDMSPDTYAKAVCAWFVAQLLRKKKEWFTKSTFLSRDDPKSTSVWNILPEDFSRAWAYLRFCEKNYKDGQDMKNPPKPRKPKDLIWHNENQFVTALKQTLPANNDLAQLIPDTQPSGATEPTDDNGNEIESEINNVLVTTAVMNLDPTGPNRNPMADEVRENLINQLESRVVIAETQTIDPEDTVQATLAEIIADSTHAARAREFDEDDAEPTNEPADEPTDDKPPSSEGEPGKPKEPILELSAQTADYFDACLDLELNPMNPCLFAGTDHEVKLKAWQVPSVHWMLKSEQSEKQGGILADAYGVGKTITTLSTIASAPKFRRQTGPFRSNLIIVPSSSVIDVWKDEIDRHFSRKLKVYIYHAKQSQTHDSAKRDATVDAEDFSDLLASFDKNKEETAYVVILTTYNTWSMRSATSAQTETQSGDGEESSKQKTANVVCRWADAFNRVVLDEAHLSKDRKRQRHKIIKSMNYQVLWAVTATPLINKSVDLLGLLNLLFRESWLRTVPLLPVIPTRKNPDPVPGETCARLPTLDEFRTLCANFKIEDQEKCLWMASPELIGLSAVEGDIPPSDTGTLFRPVFEMFVLRRTMKTPVIMPADDPNDGLVIRPIGSTLLGYQLTYIALKPDKNFEEEISRAYYTLLRKLVTPKEGEPAPASGDLPTTAAEAQSRFNWSILRRLSQLSLSPKMERFTQATHGKNLASHIREVANTYRDGGATFFHRKTCTDKSSLAPMDAFSMSYYIAADSAKLQKCAVIARDIVLRKKTRVTFVFGWPNCLWVADMLFKHLGFRTLVLDAGLRPDDRKKVGDLWNDPQSPYDILLFTYATGPHGLNLHMACHHLVLVETPPSVNHFLQVVGRKVRVGQKKRVQIYMLSLANSWNRIEEYSCAKKFMAQLSSDYAHVFPKIINPDPMDGENNGTSQANTTTDEEKWCQRIRTNVEHCNSVLKKMMGWKESRLEYDDWFDIGFGPGKAMNGDVLMEVEDPDAEPVEAGNDPNTSETSRPISHKLVVHRQDRRTPFKVRKRRKDRKRKQNASSADDKSTSTPRAKRHKKPAGEQPTPDQTQEMGALNPNSALQSSPTPLARNTTGSERDVDMLDIGSELGGGYEDDERDDDEFLINCMSQSHNLVNIDSLVGKGVKDMVKQHALNQEQIGKLSAAQKLSVYRNQMSHEEVGELMRQAAQEAADRSAHRGDEPPTSTATLGVEPIVQQPDKSTEQGTPHQEPRYPDDMCARVKEEAKIVAAAIHKDIGDKV